MIKTKNSHQKLASVILAIAMLLAFISIFPTLAYADYTPNNFFLYVIDGMYVDSDNGQFHVQGWVCDMANSGATISVINECNGANCQTFYRRDVNEGLNITGNHGFDLSFPVNDNGSADLRLTFYCEATGHTDCAFADIYSTTTKGSYSVSYNANGGSGAPAGQTKIGGVGVLVRSATPTRSGYSFEGWSASSGGSVSYKPGDRYTTDASVTFYAVWKPNTYTVSFNANGGSGAPAAQTKTHDKTLTLTKDVPIRDGYAFLGWSESSSATSASYQAGGSYTANKETTLYAVWEKNTYTVTYDANGGSGAPAEQTKTHGQTLNLSSIVPVRLGYVFQGWARSSDAKTADYEAGGSYEDNAELTLYAVWTPEAYTGSAPVLSAEAEPVKAGDEFHVTVSLEGAEAAYGVSFTLEYDSELMCVESFQYDEDAESMVSCNLDYADSGDQLRVSAACAGALGDQDELIDFTFTALEEGEAEFCFVEAEAFDQFGRSIESTQTENDALTVAAAGAEEIEIEIDEPPASVGATITAPEGGWVEGENTFTVECEKACVLLVTDDGGETYTRLKATAGDGEYSFTANLTADSQIVCAVKGDLSGDGRIRANEAKAVLKASAGGSVTALQKQIADVNGDGKIRANEAKAILKASAGGSLSW